MNKSGERTPRSSGHLESLKRDLGKEILLALGISNQTSRIEPVATIRKYTAHQIAKIRLLVIGLNGYCDEELAKNNSCPGADYDHPYFNYFRDFMHDLVREDEIGFFDLIPVRTQGKAFLTVDRLLEEFAGDLLEYLEEGIEIYNPDIIIANSSDVSRFIETNLSPEDSEGTGTVFYYKLRGRIIPVILSGHISGARRIDSYNRIRILREMSEEIHRVEMSLSPGQVVVRNVHKHDVSNCEVCKHDVEKIKKEMSYRDYDEADRLFGEWKKHVNLIGMSEK